MMLATKAGGVDPGSLNSWLDSNGGYSGCDIYWGSVDKLGLTSFQGIENASESEICNGLSQGHGIIANVMNGGHWVLLTGSNFIIQKLKTILLMLMDRLPWKRGIFS